jgi:hypothetical protein
VPATTRDDGGKREVRTSGWLGIHIAISYTVKLLRKGSGEYGPKYVAKLHITVHGFDRAAMGA